MNTTPAELARYASLLARGVLIKDDRGMEFYRAYPLSPRSDEYWLLRRVSSFRPQYSGGVEKVTIELLIALAVAVDAKAPLIGLRCQENVALGDILEDALVIAVDGNLATVARS